MKSRNRDSPLVREMKRLHAKGKPADVIALRLGVKISRVLATIKPVDPQAA